MNARGKTLRRLERNPAYAWKPWSLNGPFKLNVETAELIVTPYSLCQFPSFNVRNFMLLHLECSCNRTASAALMALTRKAAQEVARHTCSCPTQKGLYVAVFGLTLPPKRCR